MRPRPSDEPVMKTRAMVFSYAAFGHPYRSPRIGLRDALIEVRLLAASVSAYNPSQIVQRPQFSGGRNHHPSAQFPLDRPGEARSAGRDGGQGGLTASTGAGPFFDGAGL